MAITKKIHHSTKSYAHLCVMFVFMFGFQFLPPIGAITPLGMKILGIFIGVIYGWSTVGIIIPGFIGLALLGTLPDGNAIEIFKDGFGNRLTVGLFLLFLFGEIVTKSGVSKYIADWCTSRKFLIGKPYYILAMFCIAGGLIASVVSCFAAIVLMWGIVYGFFKAADIKPGEPIAVIFLIGVVYAAVMAGGIFPFMGLSLLVNGLQIQLTSVEMPYVAFSLMQLFMTVLAMALYFAVCIFVIKPDVSKIKAYNPGEFTEKMTGQQRFVTTLLIIMCVTLFLPGILPKDFILTQILKALDISGVVGIAIAIYYIANMANPNSIPFRALAMDVSWNVIVMFATIAPLAGAVMRPEAGIIDTIVAALSGVVGGMSPIMFIIVILFIASILTQFCNNVSIIMITLPIMYTFGVQIGVDLVVLSILVAFNLNVAFCTPAASGYAAMIFANQEWITSKRAYSHSLIIFVINMVVTIIGLFVATLLI